MDEDRDKAALRALTDFFDSHRPLVLSVCRRLLRRGEDVEDACQETFIRLVRHAGLIHGSLAAWLATTARSVCLEMIRRDIRERRRREVLATSSTPHDGDASGAAKAAALTRHLPAALERLDAPDRELIVRRFLHREPLRVLAGEAHTSVATASRRAAAVLERLAEMLRSMGVDAAQQETLADLFGDPILIGELTTMREEPLRFAPDWRSSERVTADTIRPRLRCGAVAAYRTARTVGKYGIYHAMEEQVWTSRLIADPSIELVGIVERDTTTLGPVERTLREYELTAGMIAADDVEALLTLDVILLGISFAMSERVATAINTAVRAGVGLVNEYWTGSEAGSEVIAARELMLAGSPVYGHHEPPHCSVARLPARVIAEHPLLPGFRAGDEFIVNGCGPTFVPLPGATTCIVKDRVIGREMHGIPGAGDLRPAVFVVGQLGRGRVVWSGLWKQQPLIERLSVTPEAYIRGLLDWVAKPADDEVLTAERGGHG